MPQEDRRGAGLPSFRWNSHLPLHGKRNSELSSPCRSVLRAAHHEARVGSLGAGSRIGRTMQFHWRSVAYSVF